MFRERRLFKRFQVSGEFRVTIGGRTYGAEVLDYSFDGFRVRIEGEPEVSVGEQLSIGVSSPAFKGRANVVWAKKAGGEVVLGLRKEGLLYGSLRDFTLADILIGLQRSGKTGILNFIHGYVHKNVYFQGGDMVFAASNQAEDRLGELLLREGKITTEQFRVSHELSEKIRKRHGSALVELGYISPGMLMWAVNLSVENIILSLFSYREGRVVFKEGTLPTEELITLRLSAANLIYKGIKGIHDVEHIKQLCPPGDTVMVLASDPMDLFQDLKLVEQDKRIMTMVDGKRTFKEIIKESGVDVLEAMKVLFALMSARVISPAGEAGPVPEEVVTAEEVVSESTSELSQDFATRLEHLYGVHKDLGYYDILDVEKGASESDIKKAYYRMAREFHPDRHFQLPEEMRDKLNTVFAYISTAYTTLMNPAQRKDYDEQSAGGKRPGGLDPPDMAKEKFVMGKDALARARFEEAAKLFAEAAYLESTSPDYHYYSGMALRMGGKHKEAEKALQRALKIDPSNADYLAEAGNVYLALGFNLRAKSTFGKALEIDPAHKTASEGLSMIPEE